MVIDMNDAQLHTPDQLRAFLNGNVAVGFAVGAQNATTSGRQYVI
jgi:hypothetical protein